MKHNRTRLNLPSENKIGETMEDKIKKVVNKYDISDNVKHFLANDIIGLFSTELTEAKRGQVEAGVICPICKTDKLEDISPRKNNGVLGSGFASWEIIELRKCPNCHIILNPPKGI